MKTLHSFLVFLILSTALNAQAPSKFSYQAVVRDGQGHIVANKNIAVRITVLRNTVEVYKETSTPQTNANGLFSIEIGGGNRVSGNFNTINWSSGKYFVKTEIDLNGRTNYTLSSTTELLSVPYALHAQTAQKALENPQETDPVFSASAAKSITGTDIQNWNNKLDTADLNTLQAEVDVLKGIVKELQIANGLLVEDIDGNIYKTVKIGNQTWFAENLKVTRFNNGDPLMNIQEKAVWDSYRTQMPPAYCYYNNDPELGKFYGNMYNWFVVSNTSENQQNAGRKICPTGWHVPSESEWQILSNYLIANGHNYDNTTSGNKIAKALAIPGLWDASDVEGAVGHLGYAEKMNTSGFSVLPGGFRNFEGNFNNLNRTSYFMTSTGVNSQIVRDVLVASNMANLVFCDQNSYGGFYIRCVKD